MIKIVLHCLPKEIDRLYWTIDQLIRASRYIDPKKFILDFTLNVSDDSVNWEESLLTKEYCIEKFNLAFLQSPFINQNKISHEQTGCNTVRRNAIRKQDDTTHIIYLDADIIFPEWILYYMYHSINQITNKYYIVSPQIFQLWDTSWDVISHPSTRNISRTEKQWLKDPFQVFDHEIRDVRLITTPHIKLGGGLFNMFNKQLLEMIDIPDSLGHYGMDDTYVVDIANMLKNTKDIQQFVLNDIIVKEDRMYGTKTMDPFIVSNDKQTGFRDDSNIVYANEIQKVKEKIQNGTI